MDALEPALSIGVLVAASAIATNAVASPPFLASTPSGIVLMVIGLLASVVAPTLAVAILILAVVLLYKRNIHHTVQGTLQQFEAERATPEVDPRYGERRIPTQDAPSVMQTPGADGVTSGPGTYGHTFGSIEGFTPATVTQSMELNPPKGQFPTQESRDTASPVTDQYTYRPSDAGSNEFHRFGPQMDQKVNSFRYYN